MNHGHPSKLCGAIVLAALAVGGVGSAGAAEGGNFHVGVTAGFVGISPRGYDVDTSERGRGHVSGGFFVGAHLTNLKIGKDLPFFIEAGYQDIARHRMTYHTGSGSSELTARGHSTYVAAKLDIPFSERFGMFARLGVARSKIDGSTPPGAPVIDIDGRHTGVLTGVGLHYHLAPSLTLRGDVTGFNKASNNADAGALNVGVALRF